MTEKDFGETLIQLYFFGLRKKRQCRNERIAVLERKTEQLSPEILKDFSPEVKATKFSGEQESWKGNK